MAKFFSEELVEPGIYNRIMKAANFQEPDRVPIWDFIDNRYVLEHFAPGETDLLKANVKVYHGLEIDLCRGFGESFAQSDNGKAAQLGNVETLISGQTRWEVRHAIKNLDELRSFVFQPPSMEWVRSEWIGWVKNCQKAFAPYTMYVPGAGCGFHATYGIMGLEIFSEAIYDATDEIMRLLEAKNKEAVQYARAAAEERLCPLFFIGDDIAYKGRLMFSPSFLRKTFIPMLKNMCGVLHKYEVKVIFHSDGNVMEILEDMIEAGIDGLNPIEPLAGMDIAYLKKRYYGKLILVGNVDCSQVLPLGSTQEVIDATKKCIRDASPGGGHFIGSSSEITPSTPLENIITFYKTIIEYGKYPIRL